MSERIRSITALAVIAISLIVVVVVLATDSTTEADRVESLAVRLKCPVCTSESIADSPAQVSRDLYDLIGEQVADGLSDQQILDFFVATYGDEVLLDPPATGATSVLWVAPLVLLAVGGVVIAGRRAASGRDLTDEERAAVRRALEDDA